MVGGLFFASRYPIIAETFVEQTIHSTWYFLCTFVANNLLYALTLHKNNSILLVLIKFIGVKLCFLINYKV